MLTIRLTYPTTCWWCGAPVFFHRDENGGCVLFDELGPPWQVHACWEEHREQQQQALVRVRSDLLSSSFDGRFYKPAGKRQTHRPGSDTTVEVHGFVADNHVCYQTVKRLYLRSARGASGGPLIKIEASGAKKRLYVFLVPEPTARNVSDYSLITVRGVWIQRNKRWLLLATELEHHDTSSQRLDGVRVTNSCRACGNATSESRGWGVDTDYYIECAICGSLRRAMPPAAFIEHSKKIAEANTNG